MREKSMAWKKFICIFGGVTLLLFAMAAGCVYLVDPFYHYHAPIGGCKAVVTKPEYQCIGTIRNFQYDSLVLGSSVAENYNNHWFDESFGGTTIKGIQKSAETVDLLYYLEEAYQDHDLKNVYYSLDVTALCADANKVFPNDSLPLYMFDHNWLNDAKYLLNKDVLLEDVPYMLAMSFMGEYDEGESYNWWQYKHFSKEGALQQYQYTYLDEIQEEVTKESYQPIVDENIALLAQAVEEHPETTFRLIYPPYSELRWDEAYRGGVLEEYFYATEASMERLLQYSNVELYYYQNDADVICNLDNYMDTVHFSEQINHAMVLWMAEGTGRVTVDNYQDEIAKMRRLVEEILTRYEE